MLTKAISRHISIVFTLVFMGFAGSPSAHEIRPAVADLTISGAPTPRLQIEIDFNAELFLADLDASAVRDTDEAPEGAQYDDLRRLTADALTLNFTEAWPQFAKILTGTSGDSALDFELDGFRVNDNPALNLPRSSKIRLSAPLENVMAPVRFGWDRRLGPLVLRQQAEGVDTTQLYTAYLAPGSISDPITVKGTPAKASLDVFFDYVNIGFIHILPRGFDHILFVLGLFFFAARWRPLLLQVTLFTVAHTLTLALATTGIVVVSAAVIEPLIAASIIYVAVENLRSRQLHAGRLAVVFSFGLLHGLGFASVLADIGLPPDQFILSLISFNIGVELGQLAVLLPVYIVFGLVAGNSVWYQRLIATPASIVIAGAGLWMLATRLIGG